MKMIQAASGEPCDQNQAECIQWEVYNARTMTLSGNLLELAADRPRTEEELISAFAFLRDITIDFNDGELRAPGPSPFRTCHDISAFTSNELKQLCRRQLLFSSYSVFAAGPLWYDEIDTENATLEGWELDDSRIQSLLDKVGVIGPAIEAERAIVMPRRVGRVNPDLFIIGEFQPGDDIEIDADFHTGSYVPIYDSLKEAKNEYSDYKDALLRKVYLPYFKDIPLSELVTLAGNETDALIRFQNRLAKDLGALAGVQSEKAFEEVMKSVDDAVRDMDVEWKKIKRLRSMLGYSIGTFSISLLGLTLLDPQWQKIVATILGTGSLTRFVGGIEEQIKQRAGLERNPYWIAWHVHHKYGDRK